MFSSNTAIQEICISLGFRQNEAAVLVAMLEIGPANITTISLKANLARQTSFYILESLLKEKLVSETRKKEERLFFTNTRLLEDYFKKKEQQTRNAKKSVSKIRNLLKNTETSVEDLPKAEYYRGKMGLIHLLQDILDVAKSASNKEFRAYALSAFYPGMEEQFKDFILQI